jgi:hypothetical protein
MVYVLRGPRGGIIEATVSTTKEGAQGKAYNYLHNTTDWAKAREYAYQWDKFVAERRRRGYRVCRARLTVLAQLEE